MVYAVQALNNMITNQLEPSGVHDPELLAAIRHVPREAFVSDSLKQTAYLDEELPLGHNRSLMEPRIFGKILQYLQIQPGDKVLDLAGGSGYSTAIMTKMGAQVTALESVGELAEQARQNLRELKLDAQIFGAALTGGYSLKAPYDIIFINGAVDIIPDELFAQLGDKGRLVTFEANVRPIGSSHVSGQAVCYHCENGNTEKVILFDCAVTLLTDFQKRETFVF